MRSILMAILITSLSGFPFLVTQVLAEQDRPPVLRHSPPASFDAEGEIIIRSIVSSEYPIKSVTLWFRDQGSVSFEQQRMIRRQGKSYRAVLKGGTLPLEYYIEAISTSALSARDGSPQKPYLLSVLVSSPQVLGHFATAPTELSGKKPFWKQWWFWAGMAVLAGGGVALSNQGSRGSETGTVVVE